MLSKNYFEYSRTVFTCCIKLYIWQERTVECSHSHRIEIKLKLASDVDRIADDIVTNSGQIYLSGYFSPSIENGMALISLSLIGKVYVDLMNNCIAHEMNWFRSHDTAFSVYECESLTSHWGHQFYVKYFHNKIDAFKDNLCQ